MRILHIVCLMALVLCLPLTADKATDQPPENQRALKTALAIQAQLTKLVAKVRPAYVMIGGGSGVLISPDGFMLTNHHVAGSRKQWTVLLPDRRRFTADMVGTDPRGDLSLLKLRKAKNLPCVPLGDSDKVRPGQWCIAIGNPWMVGRADGQPSVSLGIVSATHVYRGNYTDAIQTDAPINPGNSGGPLITMAGKLIGINGQVAVRFGTDRINSGIGFAIPSNQIKNFLAKMKSAKGGQVDHGVLAGVGIDSTYRGGTGARVMRVEPNSSAHAAGLRKGDRIIEVEGQRITGRPRLYGVLGIFPAGTQLKMKIARGKAVRALSILLTPRKSIGTTSPTRRTNAPFLGITISQSFQGPGVEVETVQPGQGAEKAGVKAGDIITHFAGTQVQNGSQLIKLIAAKKIGDKVAMQIRRGLDSVKLTATLGRRPQR